jgi:hypothetical protein
MNTYRTSIVFPAPTCMYWYSCRRWNSCLPIWLYGVISRISENGSYVSLSYKSGPVDRVSCFVLFYLRKTSFFHNNSYALTNVWYVCFMQLEIYFTHYYRIDILWPMLNKGNIVTNTLMDMWRFKICIALCCKCNIDLRAGSCMKENFFIGN